MQSNTMIKNNCKAIRLLDIDNPHLAGKVFKQNYKLFPSPITAINYAYYLLDDHNIQSFSGLYRTTSLFRYVRSQHILRKIIISQETYLSDRYHLACIRGHAQIKANHFQKAKAYYQEAYSINPSSIEALTMLAWISFLYERYDLLQQYLSTLSDVLQLGVDIEQNLDIIFAKCPFINFPYYQLQLVAYKETNEKSKAITLLKQMKTLTHNRELFSVNDIVMLSVYLNEFQNIDSLFEQYMESINRNRDEIYFVLYNLRNHLYSCDYTDEYYNQIKRSTSIIGRAWFRSKVHIFHGSLRSTICREHRFHVSYKECHYIGCPIHNQWSAVNR